MAEEKEVSSSTLREREREVEGREGRRGRDKEKE